MFQAERSYATSSFGKCRVTRAEVYGTGPKLPPSCPLRESAVTIVPGEGR